ncbi:S-adenosyl-L-methionine-dependent methyltransferase [Artomyces pyxidatus]|uniref:S-adenosyl-L-methionine-dependent methyltransferase n=1 Tax=Artomyces pyxidatus TaxID=48021 RepID=A0ACB8TF64_9AGAM|nr:S-adenosyl-L-methionine-dependent methyltransferase [Artomyces pyxidatus]
MGAPLTLPELESLQATMNHALDAVRDEIKRNKLPELSNYATEPHPLDNPAFVCPSRLYEARRLALATIGQLKSLLQQPYEKVVEQSCAVYDTAALDIFVKTGVIDRLADHSTPPEGLHVQELQKQFDLDAVKLAVILRYLASQGWLHETREGVFALTRPALELRKGNNGRKWILTPGKPKVAQSLLTQITHPEWKYSRQPDQTAFQLANDTPLTLFAWMKQRPDELTQWASSVQSLGDAYHSAIINDFPWRRWDGRTFIDCGGGQGNLSISLSEILPTSFFVVQDLPEVMPIAQANIERRAPAAAHEGRIAHEPVNFFEVQPRVGENHVYLLRYILHDWPDHACIAILKNITRVAPPSARFVIIEVISKPNTTSASDRHLEETVTLDDLVSVPHHVALTPPAYIPANFGVTAKMSLALGVHMMGVFNALERSMREWKTLLGKAGLRVVHVHTLRGMVSAIECEPVAAHAHVGHVGHIVGGKESH